DQFHTLDTAVWSHSVTLGGGGNFEFEWYTNNRSNSFVHEGVLYLQPTLTSENIGEANVEDGFTLDIWGNEPSYQCTGNAFSGCSRSSGGGNIINPIQSAQIRTADSVNIKFGRVEVRAKLPKGDWIWPAIWLLPRHGAYGPWPASGEIDIMESRGNLNYPAEYGGGVNTMGSTLHWGPSYTYNR
ncbi:concanavalin A-like lectin/glucanase domain-containing protein, partial [Blyttiomyces helicus]